MKLPWFIYCGVQFTLTYSAELGNQATLFQSNGTTWVVPHQCLNINEIIIIINSQIASLHYVSVNDLLKQGSQAVRLSKVVCEP